MIRALRARLCTWPSANAPTRLKVRKTHPPDDRPPHFPVGEGVREVLHVFSFWPLPIGHKTPLPQVAQTSQNDQPLLAVRNESYLAFVLSSPPARQPLQGVVFHSHKGTGCGLSLQTRHFNTHYGAFASRALVPLRALTNTSKTDGLTHTSTRTQRTFACAPWSTRARQDVQ